MQAAPAKASAFRRVQPLRMTAAASGYLDAVRALAALAVLSAHWRDFYFVNYSEIQPAHITPLVKILYFLTRFGHSSVMVFFVLSGFFIGSSVFRNFGRGTWSWRDYAMDRFSRLYVVLIPGLLLGWVWDFAGIHYFNRSGIYSGPIALFGSGIAVRNLTPEAFLGNLLFLQTRFTSVFGSNGPLWSLCNEFWYYVLFPLLISGWMAVRRREWRRCAIYVLFIAATVWILGPKMNGFVIWLAGAAVALTANHFRFGPSRRLLLALYCSVTGGLFAVCLMAGRSQEGNPRWDLAVGLAFALFVHGLVQVQIPIGHWGLAMAKSWAGFSFSLYVLHFPLLLFIRAVWVPVHLWQPNAVHLGYGAIIAVGTLAYAFTVAQLTERNTPAVREWLRERFSSSRSAGFLSGRALRPWRSRERPRRAAGVR